MEGRCNEAVSAAIRRGPKPSIDAASEGIRSAAAEPKERCSDRTVFSSKGMWSGASLIDSGSELTREYFCLNESVANQQVPRTQWTANHGLAALLYVPPQQPRQQRRRASTTRGGTHPQRGAWRQIDRDGRDAVGHDGDRRHIRLSEDRDSVKLSVHDFDPKQRRGVARSLRNAFERASATKRTGEDCERRQNAGGQRQCSSPSGIHCSNSSARASSPWRKCFG